MITIIKIQKLALIFTVTAIINSSCISEHILIEETKEAQRTILVYIAGENSLNVYAYNNLKSMIEGSGEDSLNGGNFLIYFDTSNAPPYLLKIKKGIDGKAVTDTVKRYEERNSASIDGMRSVLNEVFHNDKYKAKSNGLILWSHGTAWLPSDLVSGRYLRAFAQDRTDWMEINDIRDALDGYKFDFLIFDACYMGSVESLYPLRSNADYILSSPTEVMADGLPYRLVTKTLFSEQPTEDLLKEVASQFIDYYKDNEYLEPQYRSASTVLTKMSEFDNLADISREIFSGKYGNNDIFNVPLSNIEVMERLYNTAPHALYDFKDFTSYIATEDQLQRFEESLNKAIVYKETTDVAYFANAGSYFMDKEKYCGLSVYIPQGNLGKLNEWYKRLDWYNAVYEQQ